MTITARQAQRQTAAAKTMLDRITTELPLAINIITARINNGGDIDHGPQPEDAGRRSQGAHTDPTADTALAKIGGQQRWLDDINDQLHTLALTLRLLLEPCTREVITAANAEPHPRCTGGNTIDDWTRPDCPEYTSYNIRADGSYSYRADGLCDACRMRKWRHERNEVA